MEAATHACERDGKHGMYDERCGRNGMGADGGARSVLMDGRGGPLRAMGHGGGGQRRCVEGME